MKLFWHRLSSWWFATMVPAYGPVTTIAARETLRKRRLFSSILLLAFTTGGFLTLQFLLSDVIVFQKTMSMIATCVPLCALWINQRGYLKCASLLYFLLILLALFISILSTLETPFVAFCIWPALLLLPVICGLFLPAWGPLLLCLLEVAFMSWFVLSGGRSQIALYLPDPQNQMRFLSLSCTIIFLTGVFSAISAITTEKAVIRADRTTEVEQAYQDLEAAHRTIQQQALTDGLTGLPNHRAVMDLLHKELQRAHRYSRPFSVLFFDADRFKRVNDTHGHRAGDTVLCQIGERTASAVRGGDTIGRFGGEEFVVLLPEADANEARLVAERIRASVATQAMAVDNVQGGLAMTVSIGVATFPLDGDAEQELLSQADEAMYLAKRLGRNQVRSAQDVQQMRADVELMALLQQQQEGEITEREGVAAERVRETYTLRIICLLMIVLQRRDEGLSSHGYAVSDLATATATAMGLGTQQVSRIGMAALLHDIGKVAVPDTILRKSSSLSAQEWVLLREHVELGEQILEASPFLCDLKPAVRHHHERFDGRGYPDQLSGQDIPLAARIIAVAEAYDVMQRDLPYQAACSRQEALAQLQRGAGSQFDPVVVEAFCVLQAEQPAGSQQQEVTIG